MVANVFYHFDGDPEDEAAWQAFVAANSEAAATEPGTTSPYRAIKTLYELFLLFVVVVALVGTMLWQKDITQIAALEAEVQTLEQELTTQQTAASTSLPGVRQLSGRRIVQTDHLRFVVAAEDTAIIDDIAPRLDMAYGELRADLGLPANLLDEKLTILVVSEGADDEAELYADLGVIVVDMARCTEPVASDPQFVSQRIYSNLYSQLARRLLDRALMTRQIRPEWGIVITHLYSYVEQDPLAPSVATLSAYKIQQRELAQLFRLSTVQLQREPGDWMYPHYASIHAVTDAFVEYTLVTYGRDSTPQLLDALSRYGAWDEVVTAAYGIPAQQFEQDWHAYLAKQHTADPADARLD